MTAPTDAGVTAHSVTWDHSRCSHSEDPGDDYCSPAGTIICSAAPDGFCHLSCVQDPCAEYGWWQCDDCVTEIARWLDDNHHEDCGDGICLHADPRHPDAPHCIDGHPFDKNDYCNVVESVGHDGVVAESYGIGGEPPDFRDGPITLTWDEGYWWTYADAEVTG